MTWRLPVALLVLATATAGCGGPQVQLDFGGKAVPINVAFGKAPVEVPGAKPPVLQPAPSGVGVVPVLAPVAPRGGPVPAPKPVPAATVPPLPEPERELCPEASPFAFPRAEATNVVKGAVPAGLYPYRSTGTYTVNGTKTTFDETIQQHVQLGDPTPDGRPTFSVTFASLDVKTSITYAVQQPADAVPGEIGLVSIESTGKDTEQASFRPVKPLRLLQLKADRGVTWTDATNDPLSGSTATVEGAVAERARVNACGQQVDAWKATVTQRLVTPFQDVTATRTLHFATQYGGLLVGEEVSYSGKAGGDDVAGTSSTFINVDPGAR